MMNFQLPEATLALRDRVRAFITEQVIPLEADPGNTEHGPSEVHRWSMAKKLMAG
jgi:acyl-CoA dehydrogenase